MSKQYAVPDPAADDVVHQAGAELTPTQIAAKLMLVSFNADLVANLLDQHEYPYGFGVMAFAAEHEHYRTLTLYKLRGVDHFLELSDEDRESIGVSVALGLSSIEGSQHEYMIKFLAAVLNVKTLDIMAKYLSGDLTEADVSLTLKRIRDEHKAKVAVYERALEQEQKSEYSSSQFGHGESDEDDEDDEDDDEIEGEGEDGADAEAEESEDGELEDGVNASQY